MSVTEEEVEEKPGPVSREERERCGVLVDRSSWPLHRGLEGPGRGLHHLFVGFLKAKAVQLLTIKVLISFFMIPPHLV